MYNSFIGNQLSDSKVEEIYNHAYLDSPVINRAVQFWINWIFFMFVSDVLDHTEAQ